MRKLTSGLVLGTAWALLLTGCSVDREPGDSTQTLYRADQVTLLQQVHLSPGKASLVDGTLDFSLELDPQNEVHWSTSADPENEADWNQVVSVTIPAGAVTEPVTIEGRWMGGAGDPALGYEFGPEGLHFSAPIQVSIALPIDEATIPSDEELLVLYDREDGWYEAVDNEVHWNTSGNAVTLDAGIDHFSRYVIATGPPPVDIVDLDIDE